MDEEAQGLVRRAGKFVRSTGTRRLVVAGTLVFLFILFLIFGFSSEDPREQIPSEPVDVEVGDLALEVEDEEPTDSNAEPLCLPAVCSKAKSFVNPAKLKRDTRYPFIMLASYPGSGNTWMRSIIEAGTRLWSGSVYRRDEALYEAGFHGEGVNPFSKEHPQHSVIKTHWPFFQTDLNSKTTAIIYVIRSAYNAFYSEFNREYSYGHTSSVSAHVTRENLPHFFTQRKHSWARSCRLYAGAYFWQNKAFKTLPHGVNYLHINQTVWRKNPSKPMIPVLTVFYEDLVSDYETTIRLVFEFLKDQLGDAMPSVDDAVGCALGLKAEGIHRQKRTEWNPYLDPLGKVNASLPGFCNMAVDCWYEKKWGECLKAVQHVKRPYIQPTKVIKCNT